MHHSQLSSSLNSIKYKIVLLGDSGVGKSSIIDRFVKGEIDHQNQPTVGIDFLCRNIIFAGKAYRLQLWDTAGQQKYKSLVPAYLKDANCGLLVFQLNRKQSFDNMKGWLSLYREHSPTSSITMLIANKSDIVQMKDCNFSQQISEIVKNQDLTLIEVSAKSGLNINQIFQKMIQMLQGQDNEHEAQKIDEDEKANNFFLMYNRAKFDLDTKKTRCCHI